MLYQLQALPIILSVFVFQLAKLSVMQLAFFLLMFFPSGKNQYLDFYEPPVIKWFGGKGSPPIIDIGS
jgi:hypothetical protein